MLSPEKTGLLTAFLGGLPEHIAVRLAEAVEADRLAGGTSLPHAVILDALNSASRKENHSGGATDADTMQSLMERAPREILAALPVHKTGAYGGGPKAPDVTKSPDPDKTLRGIRYAKLIAACRPVAAAASFGADLKDADEEVGVHLKGYCDDIVREVRAAEGAKRVIAEQYFNLACDFTAILFSEEEAEFLRRRGRAAVDDAA